MGAGAQQAFLVPYLERVNGWSALRGSYLIGVTYLAMMVGRVIHMYLFRGWSDRSLTIVGSLSYLAFTLAMFGVAHVDSYSLALAAALVWGMGALVRSQTLFGPSLDPLWTNTEIRTI